MLPLWVCIIFLEKLSTQLIFILLVHKLKGPVQIKLTNIDPCTIMMGCIFPLLFTWRYNPHLHVCRCTALLESERHTQVYHPIVFSLSHTRWIVLMQYLRRYLSDIGMDPRWLPILSLIHLKVCRHYRCPCHLIVDALAPSWMMMAPVVRRPVEGRGSVVSLLRVKNLLALVVSPSLIVLHLC